MKKKLKEKEKFNKIDLLLNFDYNIFFNSSYFSKC